MQSSWEKRSLSIQIVAVRLLNAVELRESDHLQNRLQLPVHRGNPKKDSSGAPRISVKISIVRPARLRDANRLRSGEPHAAITNVALFLERGDCLIKLVVIDQI